MPLDEPLRRIRLDLTDYARPGIMLHPPQAARSIKLPSGRVVPPPAIPTGGPDVSAPTSGRVRMWPFSIANTIANSKAVAVSTSFQGPAVITHAQVSLETSGSVGANYCNWSLYVSEDSSGATIDNTDLTEPTGTRIFDLATDAHGSAGFKSAIGPPIAGSRPSDIGIPYVLYVPVTLSTFFLKVVVISNAAVLVVGLDGWIRVAEGADLESFSPF